MRHDYFTHAEFTDWLQNPDQEAASDEELDRAQDEVIDRLERWARSSWANVDPDAVTDDGVTTEYRVVMKRFREPIGDELPLSHLPVVAIDAVSLGGVDLTGGVGLDPFAGVCLLSSAPPADSGAAIVTYRYGWGECPWAVKRACMMATRSNLTKETRPSRMPKNTTQATSGRTTLTFREPNPDETPWPWDYTASDLIVSYWKANRPVQLASA